MTTEDLAGQVANPPCNDFAPRQDFGIVTWRIGGVSLKGLVKFADEDCLFCTKVFASMASIESVCSKAGRDAKNKCDCSVDQ